MSRKLTIKQETFALAYVETGNASEAYRRGYSAPRMKPETINKRASELLVNGEVTGRIERLRKSIECDAIATVKERQEFWTALMRDRGGDTKDRLKASEILGRAQGDFIDQHNMKVTTVADVEEMSDAELIAILKLAGINYEYPNGETKR